MKLGLMFKLLKEGAKSHAPEILTGTGIMLYGLSCYFSATSLEKCKDKVTQKKEELGVEKLPVKEAIKCCWRYAIIPGVTFGIATGCVIKSNRIKDGQIADLVKRNTALALACKGTEMALDEFEKQTKETVGEETYKEIKDKVTQKKMDETALPEELQDNTYRKTYLDNERDLYFDATYGGYFYATELEIYKAFDETNKDMAWSRNLSLGKDYKEYVPLGDLYFRLHGEPLGIGDDFGYCAEEYIHNELTYSIEPSYKTAPNGMKAFVITYPRAEPMDDLAIR